jgi:hypothetical protein
MLAIRLMQEQEIEVEALNFKTAFTCCQDQSGQAARDLGVRLTILSTDDDYFDLVRNPRFGYGKGANPCVDCRIYMFQKAKQFMEQVDAQFIVSGEVVGQRPMSQKRRDLDVISHHSDLDDLLLRPLSAKLLPPTKPERDGLVDREQLYDFQGRSRKGLIELAKKFGFEDIPTPSTGCALTEPRFSKKVFDLFEITPESNGWDFELLKLGRHFRYDERTKVVMGRDKQENDRLQYMHELPDSSSAAMLNPRNFLGPRTLICGPATDEAVDFAAGLILRYTTNCDPENGLIDVFESGSQRVVKATVSELVEQAQTLCTV